MNRSIIGIPLGDIAGVGPEIVVMALAQPDSYAAARPLAIGEAGTFALHHTIVRGDTLWDLARRYLGDPGRYRELLRGNPDVRANGLEAGEVLKIRLPGTLESVG